MKLEKAVELLKDTKFDMEENFWSKLGGDVDTVYTLKVIDPETLIKDIGIDLDEVTDEDDLLFKVDDGLSNIVDVGSEGVERL